MKVLFPVEKFKDLIVQETPGCLLVHGDKVKKLWNLAQQMDCVIDAAQDVFNQECASLKRGVKLRPDSFLYRLGASLAALEEVEKDMLK